MRCIPHCGKCNHICVNSPLFDELNTEEKIKIIFNDEKIIEDENNYSGVYKITSEEMKEFVRLGVEYYS